MSIGLKVISFETEKQREEWLKQFTEETRAYVDAEKKRFIAMAENEFQKKIVTDWFNGEKIFHRAYKRKGSEEDWFKANSIILSACSAGLG